ncbi:unnamed protein product [Amoebophrya sp. A120]|nr:unnamed protein product [Amoebophrya sp. A120]|eukprot:GSA120T00025506001.1
MPLQCIENILLQFPGTSPCRPPVRSHIEQLAQKAGGTRWRAWEKKHRATFSGQEAPGREGTPRHRDEKGVLQLGHWEDGQYRRPLLPSFKIIDCGGAVFEDDPRYERLNEISTRYYRSPEVMLGMKWNTQTDVYSFGCILLELYLGEEVHRTTKDDPDTRDLQHVSQMETLGGGFSDDLLKRAKESRVTEFFLEQRAADIREDKDGKLYSRAVKPCHPPLLGKVKDFVYAGRKRKKPERTQSRIMQAGSYARQFRKLCEKCLTLDPTDRISAQKALSHSFLKQEDLPIDD